MTLFDRLFYSGPMLAVFSDEHRIQRMLDFESALASAEASIGVVPFEASVTIAEACKVEKVNYARLRDDAAQSGNLAIPLVRQLTAAVNEISPDAARYVHLGATSQDVIDTALVLQVREALRLIDSQLLRLNEGLVELAGCHAQTAMPGRTWLQHAVPITFGWKAAGWLDATLRHQSRLLELSGRSLVLQFGGAAGTLASLGRDGPAVSRRLAEILGLDEADISWHSNRDRLAEIVAHLGILIASLGKIAHDISLLMQTEVAEVSEAANEGGGSSTMPHKRNPVACSSIIAAANRAPGLVATVIGAMGQEHERGLGNWQAEWETIPEIFNLCSGALGKSIELIAGLNIDPERMSSNLDFTQGLVYAEAVSMALSSHLGKSAAHLLVERLCRVAIESKRALIDVLADDQDVSRLLSREQLKNQFDPNQYLGSCHTAIDRVLSRASTSGVATEAGFIEHLGARSHFKCSGAKDLPVLVLSNSLGSNMTMWDAQIVEFARYFRIIRYDARGHGRSTTTPGPYSIELLGRDDLALVDFLGVESFNFCGLSMGGLVGQWMALNVPTRVKKMVLSNTAAKIGSVELWNARIDAMQRDGVHRVIPSVLERCFTPVFFRSNPGLMTSVGEMMETTSAEGYIACCAALRDSDFSESARTIQTSVLIVAGTHDPATTVANAVFLREAIPDAQFAQLDASHLSNIEAAEKFNRAVLSFLRG